MFFIRESFFIVFTEEKLFMFLNLHVKVKVPRNRPEDPEGGVEV
jgi:hypothetical protein